MVYVAINLNGLLLIHQKKGTLRVSVADTWGRMQFSNCCIAIVTQGFNLTSRVQDIMKPGSPKEQV
jgi:hypothetical protein